MTTYEAEIIRGERFEFGRNWSKFLKTMNDERVEEARRSLREMLELESLDGKTFLDVGCGSGLFSLAARTLKARVHSLEYDLLAVECSGALKQRYFPQDEHWKIEGGSVLDEQYLARKGTFDIVYSWGVLHHTGSLWMALENVVPLVAEGGVLFIAVANDQGGWSKRWTLIKKTYNRLPRFLKTPYTVLVMGIREIRFALLSLLALKPHVYVRTWTQYASARGMSRWHDMVDWIGGYPFEVAKPEDILDFYRSRGFILNKLRTHGSGIGCNEYVFSRHKSLI